MTTTITIPQEAIEELAHKVAMEIKNEQNKERNTRVVDPFSFEEMRRKVSDIRDYCSLWDGCEQCYFYYETSRGYCECVLNAEPDDWDIDQMSIKENKR